MAYLTLGQVAPGATTATTLYTVPSAKSTVCSTLTVCNRGTAGTYRVAVRPAGATLANEHYVIYDSAIAATTTDLLTIGITLATTDVVTVYASSANFSFNLFGNEA
ncbi:MAG TPA: hypothetical protein PKW63_14540 [Vicinamibacterales bacterium]|nr:hypothetical protein [Vicinamibacterales bacterium]